MSNDVNEILTQREKTHGKYADVAKLAQTFKEIIHDTPNWEKLNDGQKESLEMICNKMGRLLNGDHNFVDHWDDGAGYFTLGSRSCATSLNSVEKNIAQVLSLGNVTGMVKQIKEQSVVS